MKKNRNFKVGVPIIILMTALVFVGMNFLQAQMTIKGKPAERVKPPKDPEPVPPLILTEHNIVAAPFCGELSVLNQVEGFQYLETWKGGNENTNYLSLQIVDVNGDGQDDIVAAGMLSEGKRNNLTSSMLFEIYQQGEDILPVMTSQKFNDTSSFWKVKILVRDINFDGFKEVIMKIAHQIHVYTVYPNWSYYQWAPYTSESADVYLQDITFGNIRDGKQELILSVTDITASPGIGFLRVIDGPTLAHIADYPIGPHDPSINCFLMENIKAFNLSGDDTLEILSTSLAYDFSMPTQDRDYSMYTHLHVWEWNGTVYVPLADFPETENRFPYLSDSGAYASFDVGYIAENTIGVAIGTYGAVKMFTLITWNDTEKSFIQEIYNPISVVSEGLGSEVWDLSMADVDDDNYSEIVVSGGSNHSRKYYQQVFDWTGINLNSLWSKVESSCNIIRRHAAN